MGLNSGFDRLPRSHVRLGDLILPTYLALGLVGVAAGTLAIVLTASVAHTSMLVALALVPIAGVTFVGFSLARRKLTGAETTVLLEHVGAVLLVCAAALRGAGLPWRGHLDVLSVGLCVFLAFGRFGCLLAGCCFGRPSAIGVRYPVECGHARPVRRLPVQLVDSMVWVVLAAVAAFLAVERQDGSATAVMLLGYGVARSALEPLRGDAPRRWLGASAGQWLSGLAILAGLAVAEPRWPARGPLGLAAAGAVSLLILLTTSRRWLALEHGALEHDRIAGLARELLATRLDEQVKTWATGRLRFGASMVTAPDARRLILSVSSPGSRLVRAEAARALETLLDGLGAGERDLDLLEQAGGSYAVAVELAAVPDRPRMNRPAHPHLD